jgi:SNF2 family DNA or RNA helicase
MSDRIYRIGQKGSSVSIYNLVAADTIEEDFANIIVRKGVVMDAALDNGRKVNQVDIRLDL